MDDNVKARCWATLRLFLASGWRLVRCEVCEPFVDVFGNLTENVNLVFRHRNVHGEYGVFAQLGEDVGYLNNDVTAQHAIEIANEYI